MSQGKMNAQIEGHVLQKFSVVKKVGSGAYGHVWKVQQKMSSKILALKKIFDAFQHSTDAQRTFREIEILQQTKHPNIVQLVETIPAENGKDVYLVFQFMESDLHNAIGDNIMKDAHFKFIIYQITKALKYLHSGKIIHRDLKPSNVLINSNCKIKLCDFGLVRSLVSNGDKNGPVLTQGVATRWYRAPEVLLGSKCYSTPANVWSFGCIIFQMLCRKPLFAGTSTLDQLQKIVQFTGFPSDNDIDSLQSDMCRTMIKQLKCPNSSKGQAANILQGISQDFHELLLRMLTFNPKKRMRIEQILKHPLVKPFRKQEQEIISSKMLTTSIDDNLKLSVEQYRKLIYKVKDSSPHLQTSKQISMKEEICPVYSNKLTKIKSCKDIYQTQKGNPDYQSPKNLLHKNTVQISWKQLAKSPAQALRLSGKIIAKKPIFKQSLKKQQEKTQIQRSDIPNIADFHQHRYNPNAIVHSSKLVTPKKSLAAYGNPFSPKVSNNNNQKFQLFSPKQTPNCSPQGRTLFSPKKK